MLLYFFISLPFLALIWFIISLCRYCSVPKGSELRQKRRKMLLISGICAGVLLLVFASFTFLLVLAVANM